MPSPFVVTVVPTSSAKQSGKTGLYSVIAVVVVFLAAAGVWAACGPKGPHGVPYVVGMQFDAAQGKLKDAKLQTVSRDTLAVDTVKFKAGMVVTQVPDSGPRPSGDTVRVTVQRAWAVVPPVVGIPYDQASELIAMQGLFSRQPKVLPTIFGGMNQKVKDIVPGARSLVGKGDSVSVTIWMSAPKCQPWPACMINWQKLRDIVEGANRKAAAKVPLIGAPQPH